VTFRLWDGKREYPLDYRAQNGSAALYAADRVFLGVLDVPEASLIATFDLAQAYPNPFRGEVRIAFDVPSVEGLAQHAIEIGVYDMRGSLVKQLAAGSYAAGHHEIVWNGDDGRDGQAGSSVYFVRMKAAGFDKRLKLVRMQ
jgi:hypothetical protein